MAASALLLRSSSLLMIVLAQYFFQTSLANYPSCTPSACGVIRNISYPFRLKDDPKHCGDRRAELACENNVTFIYLNSHKYYLQEINYDNSTIRLVDVSINHTCSFPVINSADAYNHQIFRGYDCSCVDVAWPINFMSCPRPLKNISSLFTDITHDCASNYNSSRPRYTYIKVGHMNVSDVPETCGLDLIAMTSWQFKDLNNVSLSEIHHSLLYGFQLTFCHLYASTMLEKFILFFGPFRVLLLIPLVILVLLSAGGSLPMMIIIGFIIGFIGLLGILSFIVIQLFYRPHPTVLYAVISTIGLLVGVISRFIICPYVVWLLIYKFRRRRWSVFHAIECFLQSDNNLIPIRYSYSDIKKMTKGFRDKLGEGGYGSVYKGRLQSEHDVAVKLLGKSGSDGKDFMNEIATIGRIHHVNVVKLVGYCAQGSKRALVFDFMPNGSLEKYLFNREKMNSLNLDTKFEIAIGVAHGIEYLHRGCDIQILHFDIKPHNILLDDKFIPKISDFGLAKFCSANKNTVTLTAARGTIGYVAPELINRSIGAVSYKADVYSFGMVLMEMMSLKRDLIGNNGDSSQYFPCWVYDHLNRDNGNKIGNVDENENNDDNDGAWKLARKMTIVALWCIQMNPDDRPSMNKVLEMLEGEVEHLQIPNYPSQSLHIVVNEEEAWGTCSTDSVSLLYHNDAPIVEITIEE